MEDSFYPPRVHALFRLLWIAVMLSFGWFTGGVAGLLVMLFVAGFLFVGAPQIALPPQNAGLLGGLGALVRWVVYFLGLHFVVFVCHEPTAENMLLFLGGLLDAISNLGRQVSTAEVVGFGVGVAAVFLIIAFVWRL